jgi:hypothetical protein
MSDEQTFPTVEVVRDDEAQLFRDGMKAVRQQLKTDEYAAKEQRAEAAKLAQYGLADRVYFLVRKLPSKEGQPERYRAEAISGMPDPSMSVVAHGTSVEDVIFEARFHLAEAMMAAKVEPTWEECRHRAARASLEVADVQGL